MKQFTIYVIRIEQKFIHVVWNTSVSQMKTLNIFISYFIEHKRYTVTSFFYVVSIAYHTNVPALQKCIDTSRKKSLLAESTATHAPPTAPLRRTWYTCLPSPIWAVQNMKVTGGEVWRVRRMWKTLEGQILDCCNSWTGSMGPSIVMLQQNTCTQKSVSFGLDCRTQMIL